MPASAKGVAGPREDGILTCDLAGFAHDRLTGGLRVSWDADLVGGTGLQLEASSFHLSYSDGLRTLADLQAPLVGAAHHVEQTLHTDPGRRLAEQAGWTGLITLYRGARDGPLWINRRDIIG
jgi:hypothetical protein